MPSTLTKRREWVASSSLTKPWRLGWPLEIKGQTTQYLRKGQTRHPIKYLVSYLASPKALEPSQMEPSQEPEVIRMCKRNTHHISTSTYFLSPVSFNRETKRKSGWRHTHMKKSSCVRTLELQKVSCLYTEPRGVSPNKDEWNKVKQKGGGWLHKIEGSCAYKRRRLLPNRIITIQSTTKLCQATENLLNTPILSFLVLFLP